MLPRTNGKVMVHWFPSQGGKFTLLPIFFIFFAAFSSFVILTFPHAVAFKVHLKVPEVILIPSTEAGHWFNCSATSLAKEEQVFSITWSKDGEVFYTYTSSDDKVHVKMLPGKGIPAIDDSSREGRVKVVKANVNTTGCYKCEVKLTDGRAKSGEDRSTTIYLAHREGGIPSIEVVPSLDLIAPEREGRPLVVRSIGDSIGIKCRSQPSNPTARVEIKINNTPQDVSYGKFDASIEPVMEAIDGSTLYRNILYATTLKAEFIITRQMVVNGFMSLTCTSIVTSTQGFLEQQDSISIKVRVLQPVQAIFKNRMMEKQKFYLILIVLLVAGAVAMNQFCSLVTRVKRRRTSNCKDNSSVQRSI